MSAHDYLRTVSRQNYESTCRSLFLKIFDVLFIRFVLDKEKKSILIGKKSGLNEKSLFWKEKSWFEIPIPQKSNQINRL